MDRDYARAARRPEALARAALMSAGHFSRSFRAAFGETPYSHLMTRRIERAKALLRRGDMSVTDVCVEVGCTSLGSFSARFTELVGESPSAYRARSHEASAGDPACVAQDQSPDPSEMKKPDRAPPRTCVRMDIKFRTASSPSTTTTRRSPSIATCSGSRSATTSGSRACAG